MRIHLRNAQLPQRKSPERPPTNRAKAPSIVGAASARPLLLRRRHLAPAARAAAPSGGDQRRPPTPPPHQVLGIDASASAAEARRAWRARALLVHPDVLPLEDDNVEGGGGGGSGGSGSGGGSGSDELLQLNEAYAAFLELRGVRSRGAVGKRGPEDEGEEGGEEDSDDDDDPFLPPLFFSSSSDDAEGEEGEEDEEDRQAFLFVDPFSIQNFDPFRWRELQDLARGESGGNAVLFLTPETAADSALSSLARAGVASRLPPRSGVALLTGWPLLAVEAAVEQSLETMDFEGGARAVSELLARARAANSGWRRRRERRGL